MGDALGRVAVGSDTHTDLSVVRLEGRPGEGLGGLVDGVCKHHSSVAGIEDAGATRFLFGTVRCRRNHAICGSPDLSDCTDDTGRVELAGGPGPAALLIEFAGIGEGSKITVAPNRSSVHVVRRFRLEMVCIEPSRCVVCDRCGKRFHAT